MAMRAAGLAFLVLCVPTWFPDRAEAATQTCERIAVELAVARQARRTASVHDLIAASDKAESGCSGLERACLQRLAALTFRDAAHALARTGASESSVEEMLRQGFPYARPWQLVVDLADLLRARGKDLSSGYNEAARLYQAAVDDIVELPECSKIGVADVPTETAITKISRHMQEAVLLSSEFTVTTNRSGRCGGIFEERIRGFTPKARPIPITFAYDSAALSPQGERSAEALLQCVLAAGYRRITISGHTDGQGTADYNLALSSRRLATVRVFLDTGGFKGVIELLPKGESEPFEVDDTGLHSTAEIDQMNRRVELRESSR